MLTSKTGGNFMIWRHISMDILRIIQNPEAFDRFTQGTYKLLETCQTSQLLVTSPPNSQVKYEMMVWPDHIKMRIIRNGSESKYSWSKGKADLSVNGNPIPTTNENFLRAMVTIFQDVKNEQAGLLKAKESTHH